MNEIQKTLRHPETNIKDEAHVKFVAKVQYPDLDEKCYQRLTPLGMGSFNCNKPNLSECDYQICQRVHENMDLPYCYYLKGLGHDETFCDNNNVKKYCPEMCKLYSDTDFSEDTNTCFNQYVPNNARLGHTTSSDLKMASKLCKRNNSSYSETGIASEWCPVMCNQIRTKPLATHHEIRLNDIAKDLVNKTQEYVKNRGIQNFSRTSNLKQTILQEETYKAEQVANQIMKMTVSPPNKAEEDRLLNEAIILKNETLKDTFMRLCNDVRKDRNKKKCIRRFRKNKTP